MEAPLELQVGDIVGTTVHVPGMNPIRPRRRRARSYGVEVRAPVELAVGRDRDRLVRRAFERLALIGWRKETRRAEQLLDGDGREPELPEPPATVSPGLQTHGLKLQTTA